jgi:hypothetical protein
MTTVTPFLAIGLEVSFVDGDDSQRYSTGQRERRDLVWRRSDEMDLPGETAPIVGMDGPPQGFDTQGLKNRTVIHPAPKTSALWGSVTVGDELVLYRGDLAIGTAIVVWLHDLDRALSHRSYMPWSTGWPREDSRHSHRDDPDTLWTCLTEVANCWEGPASEQVRPDFVAG